MSEGMENRIWEEKIELAKKAIERGRLSLEDIAETLELPVETVRELSPGYRALMELSESAERNGISEMSLDEINAEIEASRAERAARQGNAAVENMLKAAKDAAHGVGEFSTYEDIFGEDAK